MVGGPAVVESTDVVGGLVEVGCPEVVGCLPVVGGADVVGPVVGAYFLGPLLEVAMVAAVGGPFVVGKKKRKKQNGNLLWSINSALFTTSSVICGKQIMSASRVDTCTSV